MINVIFFILIGFVLGFAVGYIFMRKDAVKEARIDVINYLKSISENQETKQLLTILYDMDDK